MRKHKTFRLVPHSALIKARSFKMTASTFSLIGKTIEYEFEELSDKNVPTKPSGVGLREVDKYGRPLV